MYPDLATWIRTEHGHHPSVDDQIVVAEWFLRNRFTTIHDGPVRTGTVRAALEDRLQFELRAVLDNLASIEIIIKHDPPGSGLFIVHERSDQVFFDPDDPTLETHIDEELTRLLDVLTDPPQRQLASVMQRIAADAIDTDVSTLSRALMSPDDPLERMARYDAIYRALDRAPSIDLPSTIGALGWRRTAFLWALSRLATRIALNETLPTE